MVSIKAIGFFVHLLLGIYFLNIGLAFFSLPEFFLNFESGIIIIGGVLIIIGGFNYLRTGRRSYRD